MKLPGKVGNGPVNKRLHFGGDPDHSLDTGIVFRIRHYWEIWKVVNGVNLLLHPVIHSYWFGSWRDWYRDTGKTCLGGGMHCLSASSSILPPYLMPLVLRGFQVVENFHDHARFILQLDHGKIYVRWREAHVFLVVYCFVLRKKITGMQTAHISRCVTRQS